MNTNSNPEIILFEYWRCTIL